MTSAGGAGGGSGGGAGGGGGVAEHQRMLKLEPGNQCVGPDNTNQFCHVLNQMYGNNYQYYDGAGVSSHHPHQPQQRCVTDYLSAYRQSHKQHYIQVSYHSQPHISIWPRSIAASLDQSQT